jgi:hypothetical protein
MVMLDRMLEWASTGAVSLPAWAIIAGLAAIVCALALTRRGYDGGGAGWGQVALVVIAVFSGWWALDHIARREAVSQQRHFEARALELATRALAPGSALACLDAIAGDTVEDACEKALFATPEATAAAIAYVSAQLSLLASSGEEGTGARRGASPASGATPPNARALALRRVLEADRYGIVAHVLAVRDGCTRERCSAFALLQDTGRISANLAERPFDAQLKQYAAGWSAAGSRAVATNPPPATASASGASPKLPGNLYFPSASSIPPVNIMTAEPPPAPSRETTGTADAGPARKGAPAAGQARPPAGSTPAPARPAPAPTPLAPPQ